MSKARFFFNIAGGGGAIGVATAYSAKTSMDQAESMSKITGKEYEIQPFAFGGIVGHRIVEKKQDIAKVEENIQQFRMVNRS